MLILPSMIVAKSSDRQQSNNDDETFLRYLFAMYSFSMLCVFNRINHADTALLEPSTIKIFKRSRTDVNSFIQFILYSSVANCFWCKQELFNARLAIETATLCTYACILCMCVHECTQFELKSPAFAQHILICKRTNERRRHCIIHQIWQRHIFIAHRIIAYNCLPTVPLAGRLQHRRANEWIARDCTFKRTIKHCNTHTHTYTNVSIRCVLTRCQWQLTKLCRSETFGVYCNATRWWCLLHMCRVASAEFSSSVFLVWCCLKPHQLATPLTMSQIDVHTSWMVCCHEGFNFIIQQQLNAVLPTSNCLRAFIFVAVAPAAPGTKAQRLLQHILLLA